MYFLTLQFISASLCMVVLFDCTKGNDSVRSLCPFENQVQSTCGKVCSCGIETCTKICVSISAHLPCFCRFGFYKNLTSGVCEKSIDISTNHCPLKYQDRRGPVGCQQTCTCADLRHRKPCPTICSDWTPLADTPAPCACIDGFFFDTNRQKCVPKSRCIPRTNKRVTECSKNQTSRLFCYRSCTCNQLASGRRCKTHCISPYDDGTIPCACKKGFFHDNALNICRKISECRINSTNQRLNSSRAATVSRIQTGTCKLRYQRKGTGCELRCKCSDLRNGLTCPTICSTSNSSSDLPCTCISGFFYDTSRNNCQPVIRCTRISSQDRLNASLVCGRNQSSHRFCYNSCSCDQLRNNSCVIKCADTYDSTDSLCPCRQGFFYDTDLGICRLETECQDDRQECRKPTASCDHIDCPLHATSCSGMNSSLKCYT